MISKGTIIKFEATAQVIEIVGVRGNGWNFKPLDSRVMHWEENSYLEQMIDSGRAHIIK